MGDPDVRGVFVEKAAASKEEKHAPAYLDVCGRIEGNEGAKAVRPAWHPVE